MSGAEVFAVLGLISSVISIIQTSRDMYDAVTSVKGLPEAFRTVSQNIPLVLNILRGCKNVQEKVNHEYETSKDADHKRALEESARAVKPIMISCEENAQKLKDIFEQVVPGDSATWLERYKKAAQAVMPGRKRRVEELMKDILEKLQLLHSDRFFQAETGKQYEELTTAIQNISELPPSLPDEDGRFSHSGSGSMNVNTGAGTQQNYNQSGGTNNRQYNAHTQSFGKD